MKKQPSIAECAIWLFLLVFSITFGAALVKDVKPANAQAAVSQQEPHKPTANSPVVALDPNGAQKSVVLKPDDPDANVYAVTHSAVDPTLWILEEVGETASQHACSKNPLLPAKKVGDYCTASFQINIKDAVCYLETDSINTIRCVWPNNKEKKK